MKDLIIIGTGGGGIETAQIVNQINRIKKQWNLVGFIDDNISMKDVLINGNRVIGTIEDLLKFEKEVYVVCSMSNCTGKKNIVKTLKQNPLIKFATIIHPSVELNNTIEIGEGSIIYPGVIITVNVKIGKHVLVGSKTGIGHGTVIKDYSSLLWNTNISGDIVINECAFIGTNTTVLQKLVVGENSVIGAGAVVTKDVPDSRTVVGVPAKVIK